MCPAYLCGAVAWPLAIMLSADQVPVKRVRSKSALAQVSRRDRFRPNFIWYAFIASHEGNSDLPSNWKPACGALLLCHMNVESMVKYLRIEIDDALEIAEKVGI